jgi:hypothetical protein
MKKIILLAVLAIFGLTTNAQTSKKPTSKKELQVKAKTFPIEGAGMVFETETINYGTVPYDADGNREFVFVNNGNKPLTIESTTGSCGCTIPTTPKESIMPGEKGVIKVHYDTKRGGQAFEKTVTVKSNAVGQETKLLKIKGNVLTNPSTGTAPTKS